MKTTENNTCFLTEARRLSRLELLLRLAMIVISLTAGISKLTSRHSFQEYYFSLFTKDDLRIHLPAVFTRYWLQVIPFLELALALGLIFNRTRNLFILLWTGFFISIQFGHYILEEWPAVNGIVPYYLLAAVVYVLPPFLLPKKIPN